MMRMMILIQMMRQMDDDEMRNGIMMRMGMVMWMATIMKMLVMVIMMAMNMVVMRMIINRYSNVNLIPS
jgi:hypothetical protein